MKIEIKEDDQTLVLTNEELDNPNFVEMYIQEKDPEKGTDSMIVSVDELHGAISAFVDYKKSNPPE